MSGLGGSRPEPPAGQLAEQHLGDRLSALVDGELGHDARERVLAHVATCPKCKAEVDAQRRLKNVFAEAAPPPPSASFLARLQGLPGEGESPLGGRFAGRREPGVLGGGPGSRGSFGGGSGSGSGFGGSRGVFGGTGDSGIFGGSVLGGRREPFGFREEGGAGVGLGPVAGGASGAGPADGDGRLFGAGPEGGAGSGAGLTTGAGAGTGLTAGAGSGTGLAAGAGAGLTAGAASDAGPPLGDAGLPIGVAAAGTLQGDVPRAVLSPGAVEFLAGGKGVAAVGDPVRGFRVHHVGRHDGERSRGMRFAFVAAGAVSLAAIALGGVTGSTPTDPTAEARGAGSNVTPSRAPGSATVPDSLRRRSVGPLLSQGGVQLEAPVAPTESAAPLLPGIPAPPAGRREQTLRALTAPVMAGAAAMAPLIRPLSMTSPLSGWTTTPGLLSNAPLPHTVSSPTPPESR